MCLTKSSGITNSQDVKDPLKKTVRVFLTRLVPCIRADYEEPEKFHCGTVIFAR